VWKRKRQNGVGKVENENGGGKIRRRKRRIYNESGRKDMMEK
jgi:hypothetical protein